MWKSIYSKNLKEELLYTISHKATSGIFMKLRYREWDTILLPSVEKWNIMELNKNLGGKNERSCVN